MQRRRLAWEIGAALVLKIAALAALYLLFFDHARKPVVTPASLAAHLAGAPAPRH